jgi:hypothetical protein
MASKTLIECQEKVDKLLLDNLSTELSPAVVDQIMCQVQQEVIRAYYLGAEQVYQVLEKERSDHAWENDDRQMGA